MNEDSVAMLRVNYESLKLHQETLTDLMCMATALATAVKSDAKLNALYEKAFLEFENGPIRSKSQKQIAQLDGIPQKLRVH